MKLRKRYLIGGIAALLILLPFALVLTVVYSQFGLRQVTSRLGALERAGVHIEGVSGTLSGPLRIAKFELFNPRVHILAHDIVIQLRVRQLFLQKISLSSLAIHDALVELHDSPTVSDKPVRFLPSFLRLEVSRAELGAARYVHSNGTTVDIAHLSSSAAMNASSLRIDDAHVVAPDFSIDGKLRLRGGRIMAISTSANVQARRAGQLYFLAAQVDGPLDHLAIKSNLSRPTLASVDLVYTRPDGHWQVDGRVYSPAFGLDAWLTQPPFHLQNVALELHANPQEIRATGRLQVPEVDAQDLAIDVRGVYAAQLLTIRSADLQPKDSAARLRVAGTIAFGNGSPKIDGSAQWTDLKWPLRGVAVVESARGTAKLSGSLPYEFAVDAAVAGPRIPPLQGAASGVISKESLAVGKFQLAALEGSIAGSANLAFAQPRAWSFTANGTALNPAALNEAFPGSVDVSLQAQGTGVDPKAAFKLNASAISGTLRHQPLTAHGGVERDARGWVARNVDVSWGATHASVDGEMRDAINARWSLTSTALEQLVPDLQGKVSVKGTATGTRAVPQLTTTVEAQSLSYAGWSVERVNASAHIDVSDKSASNVSLSAVHVQRAVLLLETLSLKGQGTSAQHRLDLKFANLSVNESTAVSTADVWFDGNYRNGRWQSTFDTEAAPDVSSTGILSSSGFLAMTHPSHAVVARDEASVDQLCLVVGDGSMCAHADWKRNGPYSAWLSAAQVPLAVFDTNPRDKVTYKGRLEGRVEASGNGTAPVIGKAGIAVTDAAIVYPLARNRTDTLQLGSGRFQATADPAQLNAMLDLKALSKTDVHGRAQLIRTASLAFDHYPLTASLNGKTADANLLPLLFPDIDRAAGSVTASLNATGTIAAPELSGEVHLENGELDSYQLNLALRQLDLDAKLQGTSIDFKGAGHAGEGTFSANGVLAWVNRQPAGQIHFEGNHLLVADLPDYRVVASPKLDFKIDGSLLTATGEVLIPSARIQPADLSNSVRISADARYTDESAEERAGKLRVDSSLTFTLGDDVRVDSFGLQGQLRGSVATFMRTGQVATGRGELSVADGRYAAYGQKLEITRGRLLFDSSPLDDPGLDIRAERKIESIEVGLNVRGTLHDPSLSFFSDPSMSQMQIVSYLVTGKPIDDLSQSDTGAVHSAQSSLALQGGGFLASQLGRRIGIEEVGVETDASAHSSLVLGKFLSPRVFVSYGISLTESINTLKLRYTLTDRWTLKGESGQANSADVEYTIEH